KMIFASSAGTVYGEADVIPTPENAIFSPISHYGATKASSELFISSFANLYDLEAFSFRLGNIYGPPSNHGVIFDFYMKLKKNPSKLEILGNGKQTKSYLYVDDCVDAHIKALETSTKGHIPLNIASNTGTTVNEIANAVTKALSLKDVEYGYTGGDRGWEGDVPKAVVDISKSKRIIDWTPETPVQNGIRKYINWLKNNYP
ncbi:MAG: NAD-dependent epimerase/dehydratase family protein, partial [Promethearchaeota archaeon]